jgi:predicted Zn-dependent peptidase
LYRRLVKEQRLFSQINAYISGDMDKGLFIVNGKLLKNIKMEEASEAIWKEIGLIAENLVDDSELQKVKNKVESTLEFSEVNVLEKAMNLSYSELLGDADLINHEINKYQEVTREQIRETAGKIFRNENCSTLYYYAN